ncbi:hypothetical protein K0A97_01120 [Patescibacteria group bacterium]|nr:hypothetical protein [Patescibacteria group bacterium]
MGKKEVVLIFGGLSFITLIIFLSLLLADRFKVASCSCPRVVSYNFIWVFILLAIFFVSSIFYYLFSLKMGDKQKTIQKNLEIIYAVLDKDEKNVLDKIIKNKGQIRQTEISADYDKIKAHRIIKRLKDKRLINTKKEGRMNKLELKNELKKELVK